MASSTSAFGTLARSPCPADGMSCRRQAGAPGLYREFAIAPLRWVPRGASLAPLRRVASAARALGVSKSLIRSLIREGDIRAIKVRRRTIIPAVEIDDRLA